MTQLTSHNSRRRPTAVFAALLFAILSLAAAGPHPQDAGRRAASGAECVTSTAPPAPFCLLCDWAVHSHVVVAVPPATMAPPPASTIAVLPPAAVPTVILGRRPTGRAPPLRFT